MAPIRYPQSETPRPRYFGTPVSAADNDLTVPNLDRDADESKTAVRAWTLPDRPNSERAQAYSVVLATIRKMTALSPFHEFHLDMETAKASENIISYLFNNFEAPAPRIIPEGTEGISLTWDSTKIKQYLMVEGSSVDYLGINKTSNVRCESDMVADDYRAIHNTFLAIAGNPSSKSSLD